MPNFVECVWLRGHDDEVAAALYGPGDLVTRINGVGGTTHEETYYPFEQGVMFTIRPEKPLRFTFTLRVRGWCRQAAFMFNGKPMGQTLMPGSFQRLDRVLKPGAQVHLALPFNLALKRWPFPRRWNGSNWRRTGQLCCA